MTYAILRAKKLKSFGALARSARHTFREQPTPNADPSRLANNRTTGAKSTTGVVNELRRALPERRRKDAVLCIEYLITASPEAFKRHGGFMSDLGNGYFKDALKWLQRRHGTQNVISATVHLDETTPHLVAYVIPITPDGRLAARHFLGGPKVLREMQDSFHEACGKVRGLLRGVRGSHAKHETVRSFYGTLAETGDAPKLSKGDYAAAALGFKTTAWRTAIKAAEIQACKARRAERKAKAECSKAIATELMLDKVDAVQQKLGHRKILIKQRERELEAERRRLEIWQRELLTAQRGIEAVESENAMLKRHMELVPVHKKAPSWGRDLETNGPELIPLTTAPPGLF